MCQENMVLEYLKSGQSITSLEAITLYGATRLSAIIFNLRKKGHTIITRTIPVINRFGKTVYVAEYSYKGEEAIT